MLRHADVVLSMSTLHARGLTRWGVPRRKIDVVIPGADPATFPGHDRGGGSVGFCSAYYDRKAPDTMLDIVRDSPAERFILLGRDWDAWERWDELGRLANLTYCTTEYENYPARYREMDVFVSTSTLEGGPIPLIEAMMSNVVPVATRTGFAEDVIDDGVNGVLLPVGSSAARFRDAIDQARAIDIDVRETVARFSWDHFAQRSYDATVG
jgi:glycosyltransferase involved in cell wall biosynthesis